MSGRGCRRPYVRQRRESDEGEEEGFLYCLMYYFDEARRESEEGAGRGRRSRRYCDDDDDDDPKKKDDDDEEEVLNPLVYREPVAGRRPRGGGMMRRAYTPDREALARSTAATSLRSRSHSQPPELSHSEVSRRQRKKK
ncbi:uncharacterized protein [Procambarus clarkii]|uniref:uncharacterized protein n=1 Tax=Procambarus clarkii TaxID=6728 RepID=UPI001E672DB7|nr:uncharacterized protein LOC123765233 [Procambarus clarkii]